MAAPPPPPPATPSASLDEITNRVFEELLQGKAAPSTRPASDQGSVRVGTVSPSICYSGLPGATVHSFNTLPLFSSRMIGDRNTLQAYLVDS